MIPGLPEQAILKTGADDGTRTRDLVLTKDALYQLSYVGPHLPPKRQFLERETGLEPATNSLEGCDSTIELPPLVRLQRSNFCFPLSTGAGERT